MTHNLSGHPVDLPVHRLDLSLIERFGEDLSPKHKKELGDQYADPEKDDISLFVPARHPLHLEPDLQLPGPNLRVASPLAVPIHSPFGDLLVIGRAPWSGSRRPGRGSGSRFLTSRKHCAHCSSCTPSPRCGRPVKGARRCREPSRSPPGLPQPVWLRSQTGCLFPRTS